MVWKLLNFNLTAAYQSFGAVPLLPTCNQDTGTLLDSLGHPIISIASSSSQSFMIFAVCIGALSFIKMLLSWRIVYKWSLRTARYMRAVTPPQGVSGSASITTRSIRESNINTAQSIRVFPFFGSAWTAQGWFAGNPTDSFFACKVGYASLSHYK